MKLDSIKKILNNKHYVTQTQYLTQKPALRTPGCAHENRLVALNIIYAQMPV